MQTLTLDFHRKTHNIPWSGLLLLALGLALVAGVGAVYLDNSERIAVAEGKIKANDRAARRQQVVNRGSAGDLQKVAMEIKHANEVIGQLNLPWEELFKAVETGDRKQVALLSIEPDPQKRQVKVTAEARNLSAMLNYARSLEQQQLLTDIFLQSHQVQQQDPEKPVRFVFTATWMIKR